METLLKTAKENINNSSSELCYQNAELLYKKGKIEDARKRALKSLAYSVGIFSPIYKQFSV